MSDAAQANISNETLDHLKFELRSQQLSKFEDASLAWLTLVPAWTEELALQAGFHTGSLTLSQFLQEAQKAGICELDDRDRGPEIARAGARALLALWPRMDEGLRHRYAPTLNERARVLPPGREQRRMIREAERYLSAQVRTSWLTGILGKGSSRVDTQVLLDGLSGVVEDAKEHRASSSELWNLTDSAAQLIDTDVIPQVLDRLSAVPDAATALRAVAPLVARFPQDPSLENFIETRAGDLDPEERAATLLLVAPKSRSALATKLRREVVRTLREIPDPATRAAAFLNAAPELTFELRTDAVGELLRAARMIEPPALRGKIMAATLPLLDIDDRAREGADLAKLSTAISDPSLKASILAAAAAALSDDGQDSKAMELAATAEGTLARAQILLETVPAMPEGAAIRIQQAIEGLPPGALEQVLSNISVKTGEQVAQHSPRSVMAAVNNAAAAGRYSAAGKLARILPDRQQAQAFVELLSAIRRLPTLKDRLQKLAELAAFIPVKHLETACTMASEFRVTNYFSVAEYAKADLIEYLRKKAGGAFVTSIAIQAGSTIDGIVQDRSGKQGGIDIPPRTALWASIAAQCTNFGAAGTFICGQVRAAVDSGATVEALEILDTAADVARIVGAELEPSVAMARHHIQLSFRQSADERHLTRYLPRKEQTDDFLQLINGPDSNYALHYLGMGGVGKTMLLRYITGRLAWRDNQKLPTTRLDFDHLSPDYPAQKPGELLANLAEELRLWGGPDQESRFAAFTLELSSVHATLTQLENRFEDPLANVRSDMFRRLIDKFAALLTDLPKPVILILDTCEELAKLEPVGTKLTSVEATFMILEALHDRVPQIRIVFAGRRLLAQAGDKMGPNQYCWCAAPGSLSERNRLLPENKDYLRLHIVRGFTQPEAILYLTKIAQLKLDPQRQQAILNSSPDAGMPADILWNRPLSSGDSDEPRYNPFDLSLYAEWIREMPALPVEVIESRETDPYVETRIEGRIFDEGIKSALPAVVLMRRFDLDMLREVVPDGAAQAYRDLGSQEWIDYQPDALQLDLNLLPRLIHYFRHANRSHLIDQAKEQLGPALARMVRDCLKMSDPFARLTIALVDATLRLLPARDAADVWDEIDRKICETANWNWAENLCRYLLEEGNAAGPSLSPFQDLPAPNPLRAAVRATISAAAVHRFPYQPNLEWWKEVALNAVHHSNPEIAEWLGLRARLVQEKLSADLVAAVSDLRKGDRWRYEQAVAAFAAACERHLEQGCGIPSSDFMEDEEVALEIRAFLAGLYKNDVPAMKELFKRAPQKRTRQRWADWRAPASLRDRGRLELLRHTRVDRSEMLIWLEEACGRLDNPDSERLISRVLQLGLDVGVPDVSAIENLAIYDPQRQPVCQAERETPPLFVNVAEALLAIGAGNRAASLLQKVLTQATEKSDNVSISAVERLMLRVTRRMRLPDPLSNLPQLISMENPGVSRFHCWWVTQIATTQRQTEQLIAATVRQGPEAFRLPDGSADYRLALDAREFDLLGKRIGRETDYAGPLREALKDEPEDYRNRLRWSVLVSNESFDHTGAPRRDALIALEEGELLALRLPALACGLFKFAQSLFAEVDDPFGELQAALCNGLARLAAGHSLDPTTSSSAIFDVKDAYEKCRKHELPIPEWNEAVDYNPPPGIPLHPWDGWLRRISYLYAAHTHGRSEADRRVGAVYNNIPQFDLVLPDASDQAEPKRTRRRTAYISIGLLAAVIAVVYLLRRDASVLLVLAFSAIAVLAFVWIEVILILWMGQHTAYWVFRRLLPRILIQPGYRSSQGVLIGFDTKLALGDGLIPRINRIFSPFRIWSNSRSPSQMVQPGYSSYSSSIPNFAPIERPLRVIRSQLILGPMPIMLVIDRTLARFPWEAPLTLTVARRTFGRGTLGEPQFIRLEEPLSSESDRPQKWINPAFQALCRFELAPLIEKVWSAPGRFVRTSAFVHNDFPPDQQAVQHIIGTATRTSSGTRFSIQRPGGIQEASTSLDVRSLSEYNAAIFIVQEEPAERLRRLDVDREQTAEARAWVTELFYSGHQCVILIPVLPLVLARDVLERLSKGLRRSKVPDLYHLIKLVRIVRATIRRFRPPAAFPGTPDLRGGMSDKDLKAALKELSLEVTLFARSKYARDENRFTGVAA